MTQEEKQLLLKDLCARLPYGVVCKIVLDADNIFTEILEGINVKYYYKIATSKASCDVECMKPYLRPLSSMTEEERQEYGLVLCDELSINQYDWLNKHMFDYRNLIPKGLALEAPEWMYDIKKK